MPENKLWNNQAVHIPNHMGSNMYKVNDGNGCAPCNCPVVIEFNTQQPRERKMQSRKEKKCTGNTNTSQLASGKRVKRIPNGERCAQFVQIDEKRR